MYFSSIQMTTVNLLEELEDRYLILNALLCVKEILFQVKSYIDFYFSKPNTAVVTHNIAIGYFIFRKIRIISIKTKYELCAINNIFFLYLNFHFDSAYH